MFAALRAGLSLVIILVVLQMFFGEVMATLIEVILKMLFVTSNMLDQVLANLSS